ncbi:MAG: peptide deformylase [bacterium]|nr:peptide deformylase [bacterium]
MPKSLPVLVNPHPLLRQRAQEVTSETLAQLRREGFIDDLVKTMQVEDGVGIAAIQVGYLHRIIVVQEGMRVRVYINPTISSRSLRRESDVEGCLSVPGVVGTVRRARSCTLKALDVDGKLVVRKARGLVARIYQHEVDHLDGVLFIDRAERVVAYDPQKETPKV